MITPKTISAKLITAAIVVVAFVYVIAFVLVAVKKEPTAALALITSFRIFTNLVAVAIVGFTLVYISTILPVCQQFVSRLTLAFHPSCTQEVDMTVKVAFTKNTILGTLFTYLRAAPVVFTAQFRILCFTSVNFKPRARKFVEFQRLQTDVLGSYFHFSHWF